MYRLIKQKKIVVGVLTLVLSLMVGYVIFSESLNTGGTASTESSSVTVNILENGKKLDVSCTFQTVLN